MYRENMMMVHFLTGRRSVALASALLARIPNTAALARVPRETRLSFGFGSANCGYTERENNTLAVTANTIDRLLTHRQFASYFGSRQGVPADSQGFIKPACSQCHQNSSVRSNHIHAPPKTRQMLLQESLTGLWSALGARLFSTSSKTHPPPGNNAQPLEESTEPNGLGLLDKRGVKEVEILACGKLYEELTKTRPMLYGKAPTQGIPFRVQYYDSLELLSGRPQQRDVLSTREKHDNKKPKPLATVCLLHGAPGRYEDFASLIGYLTERGVRVLAPNFPDYEATYAYSYRHSPRERREFLLEFFKAIRVHEIDMLVGHSGSVYTLFDLLEHTCSADPSDEKTEVDDRRLNTIRSVGLFSTPSHKLPPNMAVTPFRLFTLRLFDYPFLRPLVLACLLTFVKLQGIRNRVDKNKVEDLLIAASTVGYSEHDKMASRMKLLARHKIPALLVYGTNDRLIRAREFERLAKELGLASQSGVRCYRSDASLEAIPGTSRGVASSDAWQPVDVCRFESGGHYTFQRYASQVNEEVHSFLWKRKLLAGSPDEPESQTTRL